MPPAPGLRVFALVHSCPNGKKQLPVSQSDASGTENSSLGLLPLFFWINGPDCQVHLPPPQAIQWPGQKPLIVSRRTQEHTQELSWALRQRDRARPIHLLGKTKTEQGRIWAGTRTTSYVKWNQPRKQTKRKNLQTCLRDLHAQVVVGLPATWTTLMVLAQGRSRAQGQSHTFPPLELSQPRGKERLKGLQCRGGQTMPRVHRHTVRSGRRGQGHR